MKKRNIRKILSQKKNMKQKKKKIRKILNQKENMKKNKYEEKSPTKKRIREKQIQGKS